MAINRRRITGTLLSCLFLSRSATAAEKAVQPSCSMRAQIGDMEIWASIKGYSVEWTFASDDFPNPGYHMKIQIQSDDTNGGRNGHIMLRPGRRTNIEEVLAFWKRPFIKGRSAPVQVYYDLHLRSAPSGSQNSALKGQENSGWNVYDGVYPFFSADLKDDVIALLRSPNDVDFKIEPQGMPPLMITVSAAELEAAFQKGRTMYRELLANGANREACQGSGNDCFLTTACCKTLGRPDHCFELEALRTFRRNHLETTERGQHLLREYRYLSPLLLQAMNNSGGGRFVFLSIYLLCILPCVMMLKLGLVATPTHLYQFTVLQLRRHYLSEGIDHDVSSTAGAE